jgi:hypothetical protein
MSIRNLFAIFVLLSLLAATSAFAIERNTKYQDVFYPNGMPLKNYTSYNGQTKNYQSEYEFCGELDIPNSNLKVVTFTEIDNVFGTFEDNRHYLFISIIQQNADSWNVIYTNEITNYITLSGKPRPGYMEELKSALDYFTVSGHDAIHLNLYALLSGNGFIRQYSDVFFLMQNEKLTPILELIGDGYGGQSGSDNSSQKVTNLYLGDVESDGSTDIIVGTWDYRKNVAEDKYVDELSNKLDVYEFDSTDNRYKLNGQITKLPDGAKNLSHAEDPGVSDCCP